jgi:hypothetical protein
MKPGPNGRIMGGSKGRVASHQQAPGARDNVGESRYGAFTSCDHPFA